MNDNGEDSVPVCHLLSVSICRCVDDDLTGICMHHLCCLFLQFNLCSAGLILDGDGDGVTRSIWN